MQLEYLPDKIKSRLEIDSNGCWLWAGALTSGYGKVRFGSRTFRVHRVVYELLEEPIPDDLTCDHLCRVKNCVNPVHIEIVTEHENILRGTSPSAINAKKTHCKWGHEFTEENIYRTKDGRNCRVCIKKREQSRGSSN